MSNLYFECGNGISGDMSVGALLDLGASRDKLETALKSMGLDDEFTYKISNVKVNSIKATDFDVIIKHNDHNDHHEHNGCNDHENIHTHFHRNLSDVISIIERANATDNAKNLAKKIFTILLQKPNQKFTDGL